MSWEPVGEASIPASVTRNQATAAPGSTSVCATWACTCAQTDTMTAPLLDRDKWYMLVWYVLVIAMMQSLIPECSCGFCVQGPEFDFVCCRECTMCFGAVKPKCACKDLTASKCKEEAFSACC